MDRRACVCRSRRPIAHCPWRLAPQEKGQDALVERLGKNVGAGIGLELRDSQQQLSASNSKPVKAGMAFNVSVGEGPCSGWLI